MRTTGSVETYADLNLKRDIDAGKLPGPHLDVTGPYLEGTESYFIQMPHLTSPDDARQLVDYWADHGVTSFKAYMNITRAELKAAICENLHSNAYAEKRLTVVERLLAQSRHGDRLADASHRCAKGTHTRQDQMGRRGHVRGQIGDRYVSADGSKQVEHRPDVARPIVQYANPRHAPSLLPMTICAG